MKRKGYHEAREKKKDQRATVVSLSERQVVERSLIYSITARLVSFFGELCSLFHNLHYHLLILKEKKT